MDVRVLLSGYLPVYAYDLGATDASVSFEKLRGLALSAESLQLNDCV